MRTRTTKKDVERRLAFMNTYTKSRLDETYEISYFNGWEMYIEGSTTCSRGKLGFDYRKTTSEMMAYIDGIINALAQMPNIYPQVDFLVGEHINDAQHRLSLSFREVHEVGRKAKEGMKVFSVKNVVNNMVDVYHIEVYYNTNSGEITNVEKFTI